MFQKESLNQFLDFHFERCQYNSRIHLGVKRNGMHGIYPLFYFDTDDHSFISQKTGGFGQRNDYYITKNGFRKTRQRNLNSLFTLHNIVIDIDGHGKGREHIKKELEILAYCLKDMLFEEPDFPAPNTLVCTGRGMQLWWRIIPVSVRYMKKYRCVTEYLIKKLEEFMGDISQIQNLCVDHRASRNCVGYARLPGTYNTCAGEYGTMEMVHQDCLDLEMYVSGKSLQEPYRKPTGKVQREKMVKTSGRVSWIYTLRNLRKINGQPEEGMRDLLCFCLYNSLNMSGYPEEQVLQEVEAFNSGFDHPLDVRLLYGYLSTSRKTRGYRLSNVWMIQALAITEDEQKKIGLYPGGKREYLRRKTRQEKEERNQCIWKLRREGKTQTEIAGLVGCSQSTVSRVLCAGEKKHYPLKKRTLHWNMLSILFRKQRRFERSRYFRLFSDAYMTGIRFLPFFSSGSSGIGLFRFVVCKQIYIDTS